MKTAMQELINELQKDGFKANHYGDTKTSEILYGIKDYIIEKLLEKEKEGIICAWNDSKVSMMSGEQYFEETYNQSK